MNAWGLKAKSSCLLIFLFLLAEVCRRPQGLQSKLKTKVWSGYWSGSSVHTIEIRIATAVNLWTAIDRRWNKIMDMVCLTAVTGGRPETHAKTVEEWSPSVCFKGIESFESKWQELEVKWQGTYPERFCSAAASSAARLTAADVATYGMDRQCRRLWCTRPTFCHVTMRSRSHHHRQISSGPSVRIIIIIYYYDCQHDIDVSA